MDSAITVRKLQDIDFYQGPHAIEGIRFRTVGKEIGISSWGMNLLEIEGNCTGYPEHDHEADGQEEVYLVLKGRGTLETPAGSHALEAETLVRVAPGIKRRITPGPEGITILALGGTPGKIYQSRM